MPLDLSPLWISLKTALLATAATGILGVAVAYGMLHYRGRGKFLLEGILLSPLLLPPTVVGFLLLLLFGKNGIAGQVLEQFDFSVVFTWYGAIVAATVVAFPLMYKTTLGAFEQVDRSLLAVARTLGASEWRVFYQILLPLALPGIVAGTLLAFARAMGEFGATLMLAGNIPGETQTMPMAIYFAMEAGAIDEAWFWSIAIISLSFSGIFAVNLWQQAGVSGWEAGGRLRRERSAEQRSAEQRSAERRQKAEGRGQEADFGVSFDVSVQPNSAQSNEGRGQRAEGRRQNTELAQYPLPQERKELLKTRLDLRLPMLDSPSPHLTVDIQKQLPGFKLAIAFDTANDTLGILGRSGAGKSMLLRCLAGMETPTRGRIVLNGRVLFDAKRGINVRSRDRRIGFLTQNYALFPHMTVTKNIAFGLPKGLTAQAKRQQVERQLVAVKLAGLGDRYPHQLSGGQQQRVALARALASQPEALLLDEPFSALDTFLRSQLEQEMTEQLKHFQGASLLVTHNLEEAYRVCQDLMVLDNGRAIAHAPRQRLFDRPTTYAAAQLTGCQNISRAIAVSPTEINAIDWGVHLHVTEPLPDRLAHVGIRAHQLSFTDKPDLVNAVPCWLTTTSETPDRMTLYLTLQSPPDQTQDYHMQAEVSKELWATLRDRPCPWLVQLEPSRFIVMAAATLGLES